MGLALSRQASRYRHPTKLNGYSLDSLSRYIHRYVQKDTNTVPFQVQCVVWYNDFYNWAASLFWRIFYNNHSQAVEWAEIVGSYSEISCVHGSDVDMLTCRGAVYADENDIFPGDLFGLLVVTDDERIPPGCCWLRRFRNKCEVFVPKDRYFECEADGEVDGHTHYPCHNNMDKIVCYRGAVVKGPENNDYFSSKIFSRYHGKKGLTEFKLINLFLPQWDSHGPTFTQTYFGFFTVDVALCLRCFDGWPDSASDWATRTRPFGWPLQTLIDDIVRSGFDVVAIPSKITEGETADLEWRISFRIAETKLIKSFNETQRTCFLILKILVKQVMEPMFPDLDLISTYTMKTLMFWIVERTNPDCWNEDNLLGCLQLCFDKLYEWLRDGYCPSYFIPTYNLFRTKLITMEEVQFQERLQSELEKGWVIILECEYFSKLREVWVRTKCTEEDFINLIKEKLKHGAYN